MTSEIYYFSGAGNSLAVARDIALKLDAQLYASASLLDEDRIRLDAEVDAKNILSFRPSHTGLSRTNPPDLCFAFRGVYVCPKRSLPRAVE